MTDRSILGRLDPRRRARILGQYISACCAVAIITYVGVVVQIHILTISCLYLLTVVILALLCGFWQASFASLIAVVCLEYYFTPPVFNFSITDVQDYVELGAFELTALVISRLSARELRNAREALIHRTGMDQLYELSRSTLLLDMRQAPGPQLVVLIERIFNAKAVALFDVNLARLDKVGDWKTAEEELAKQCYLRDSGVDDEQTQTSQRVLRAGLRSIGALVVRGDMNSRVVDALASLAAIAIDRYQSFEKEDRAESAKQSEQLRAAVLDALAHEFKTPLTAIQAASSGLLELGGMTASQKELVSLVDAEAIHLNELCTRLLQTARLETEQVGLLKDEVNVEELISEVVDVRAPSSPRNEILVLVDDAATSVRADRSMLAMILAQYVDNARKYSRSDTPITITAQRSHTEVLISVHNLGSAIPIEDREQIFERFYRSPESKNSIPGTGIGLSIVRKAAEAHHGHVWVISDEKQGTTFFLSLPEGQRRKH